MNLRQRGSRLGLRQRELHAATRGTAVGKGLTGRSEALHKRAHDVTHSGKRQDLGRRGRAMGVHPRNYRAPRRQRRGRRATANGHVGGTH